MDFSIMNYDEIKRSLKILKEPEQLFEVRIKEGKKIISGYFKDADICIKELKKIKFKENINVYLTLNVIDEACYSRKQRDTFVYCPSETTNDGNILGYQWMVIDIDPRRPSGTSSSNDDLKLAEQKVRKIHDFMRLQSWQEPIIALSGNGYHLLYSISLKKDKEPLIKKALTTLATIFNDEHSEVDVKVSNPARVCKLYGTMAQKGANTKERPHRMSKILHLPNQIRKTDIAVIEKLALMFDEIEETKNPNYIGEKFNLETFIQKNGIRIKEIKKNDYATLYVLNNCLFDDSHAGYDAAIMQLRNGAIKYKCFHNSCDQNTWQKVRTMFEPDAYNKTYVKEIKKPNAETQTYEIKKLDENEPIFKTSKMIRAEKVPEAEYIKTGILNVDRKILGLKKGFVTCLSGLRACGKSSIISQITIEAVEQGYKVAIFSGELTNLNTLNWLTLQAAGRDHVRETQNDGFYETEKAVLPKIDAWLDENVYVYNNNYGNNFEWILEQLKKIVAEKKVDLVILDNLMALNINNLGHDKFVQQSLFVEELENFAKQSNIHILFVAHPRKSNALLRLDDISGSNDIVNRVDNALILHRVNNDFKRLAKEMFGNSLDQIIYEADNVIEICKDRDGGVQDYFVPLYFEKSCKRLCNYRDENKIYKWEK